jgi:hypothetical protein
MPRLDVTSILLSEATDLKKSASAQKLELALEAYNTALTQVFLGRPGASMCLGRRGAAVWVADS